VQISRTIRVTALAFAVGALMSAGSAMAGQKLYGGGATFPAVPYTGSTYLDVLPNARLSTANGNNAGAGFTTATIGAGSLFDSNAVHYLNTVSYCQTGSGFGKNALNGAATALASGQCKDFSTSPAGLSAPTDTPDFIGADAPYSTTDYNAFLAGPQFATHTGVVQIPTIAGAIALPHNTDVDNVALTPVQVCRIYSGLTTSWGKIGGVTGTGNKSPIKIIYRTDSSGTTFAFTRYLAATCNGTTAVPAGFVFTPSSTFNSALPGGVTAVYGTRAIGASGNNGVVAATLDPANASALGYADIGEVLNQGAGYAIVAGFDPAKFGLDASNVPTPISISLTSLLTGKVLDGATANDVPGANDQSIKNCVRLIDPAFKLTRAYPIVAITYFAANYSGNGTTQHQAAIRNLLNLSYNHSFRPVLPTGYAYIDGVATFRTSITSTVNACIKP